MATLNKNFRYVLSIALDRHDNPIKIEGKNKKDDDDGNIVQSVEFFHSSDPDLISELQEQGCILDSDGTLTGAALQLALHGYLRPMIQSRWGMTNYMFEISQKGVELAKNAAQLNRRFPVGSESVGFIVMAMNEHTLDAYEAIKRAITKAGYEPIRIDDLEQNNAITEQIHDYIDNCKFVVADITGDRPNCFYEVGYAFAKDKDIFLIKKQDDKPVPFDVSTLKVTFYSTVTHLEGMLSSRIAARFGVGSLVKTVK